MLLTTRKKRLEHARDHWRERFDAERERARARQAVIEAAHDLLDDAGVAPGGLTNRILELEALGRARRGSIEIAELKWNEGGGLGYELCLNESEDPLDEGDPPSLAEQVDELGARCKALEASLDEAEEELGELREENARLGLQNEALRGHEKHMAGALREINERCDEAGVPEGYYAPDRVAMALGQRG